MGNLDNKVKNERFMRYSDCSLCKQRYQGDVAAALGWACWKTYVGRPEADEARCFAIILLGNGLHYAEHHEDELSVREAYLSMLNRLGCDEETMLVAQANLANTYDRLGRGEEAVVMFRDCYYGHLKLDGEEHSGTLEDAFNYANCLVSLQRFK